MAVDVSACSGLDFDKKPLIVFWETTRACLLACRHCRASAISEKLPGELSTDEGRKLLADVREFGLPYPIIVFTGGDPLMRGDLFELIEHAARLGLRVAVSPSVTPLLTDEVLLRLKSLGVEAVSVSLDGASGRTHDAVRGQPGTWRLTLAAIRRAVEIGLKVQVNTTVMRNNLRELADIFHLIKGLGASAWEAFFLVRTGRGGELDEPTPEEWEDVANFLLEASRRGLTVRTSMGPHFRRVARQRLENPAATDAPACGPLYRQLARRLLELEGPADSEPRALTLSTGDGRGIVFVAYNGDVFPSGFLPVRLGNIREVSLVDIYRRHPLLKRLRDPDALRGRCGRCEYRALCGGSRARAYAAFGDPLQEDPACAYNPASAVNSLTSV